MASDIRWRVIMPGRPLGMADQQLGEFTAPDKRAAETELIRCQDAGQFPRGAIVVSALQHEQFQGEAALRARTKEIKRQARLARYGRRHSS
jgi:hypothetical protein